jgi:uncharacterized protein YkwD
VRRLSLGVLVLIATMAASPDAAPLTPAPVVAGGQTMGVVALPYRVPAAAISTDLELTALHLLNRERRIAGFAPLMPHATIRAAARIHARELFALGYLSHRSRDGRSPNQRVKGLGVRVRVVGENLAYAATVRDAHKALLASQAHRHNILFPGYRLTGIAVLDGGPFGVLVVQDFSD